MTNTPPPGQYPPPNYGQPGYPPHQQQPYYTGPPAPQKKPTPKWVWIAGGIVGLLVLAGIGKAVGGDEKPGSAVTSTVAAAPSVPSIAAPAMPSIGAPTTATSTAAPARDVVIPDVIGKNGQIAADELKKAGFTAVSYASATPGDSFVVILQNWTVTEIEPGAGNTVATDSPVVLTMVKKNR